MAPFGSLLSLSFSLLFPTHGGFNNFQLNMMVSEPFFYQSVLLDARRWYTKFYCIPTDRTAFGIHTWPRLVLHVGQRLVFFGGDGVWAKCHASSCMTCFLLAASFRPFQRRRFIVRSRSKKKKNDFCGPLPARGGFVRTPRTPYSYAPDVSLLLILRPSWIRHSSHKVGGWQAKMASSECWIPWRNAHRTPLYDIVSGEHWSWSKWLTRFFFLCFRSHTCLSFFKPRWANDLLFLSSASV